MDEISISALSQAHQSLRELMVRHQLAYLSGDLGQARERFLDLVDALEHHAQEEDGRLLPLYRERARPSPGGDWRNFTGEHEKIRLSLAAIGRMIGDLSKSEEPRRAVLAVLDLEARLKDLLEHHFKREETFLFPELDRLMDDDEKRKLLSGTLTLKFT